MGAEARRPVAAPASSPAAAAVAARPRLGDGTGKSFTLVVLGTAVQMAGETAFSVLLIGLAPKFAAILSMRVFPTADDGGITDETYFHGDRTERADRAEERVERTLERKLRTAPAELAG